MKTYHCDQYSDEWWRLRRGVPTASQFDSILTPKTMKYAAGARSYIYQLVGDRFDLLYPRKDEFATAAMRRGTEQEPESRAWYTLRTGCDVMQVGFVTTDDGRFGCSPDGLVGMEGGLEMKNPTPKVQAEYRDKGGLPAEYRAQVHGALIVTGAKFWDFLSWCPGLPPLLVRTVPDGYTEQLREALEQFWKEYSAMVARFEEMLRNAGEAEAA
jgi:hypothetical protein